MPATLTVAVDGSCLGNPGPGGWAWYLDQHNWQAGGLRDTTNNAAELTAIAAALAAIPGDQPVVFAADSRYAIDACTTWVPGWQRRGWRTSSNTPVANGELIRRIVDALDGRDVRFTWVRGHAGHHLNESADRAARAAALCVQRGEQPRCGPGWTVPRT
jgi:ribonuclease HI